MCLDHTHATAAAAVNLTVCELVLPFTHTTIGGTGLTLAASTLLAFGAGPLNDIDQHTSTVAHSMGWLTQAFYWLIKPFTKKHRLGTHCLLGIAVFVFATWLGVLARGNWAPANLERAAINLGRLWLWFILAVLVSSAVTILFHHAAPVISRLSDLIGGVVAAIMVWTSYDVRLAAVAVAVGMLTHLVVDSFTEEGCPWLYPFTSRRFHLPPLLKPLWFKVGGRVERDVFAVLVIALLYLIAVRSGLWLPGENVVEAIR